MHGFSRKDYKERRRTPALSAKALKLRALESELLKRREKALAPSTCATFSSDREGDLDLTLNYLLVNPDPLWAWGFRRKLLLLNSEAETGSLMPRVEDELELTTTCLLQNPKCYGAWLHRKWLCVNHPGRRDFWLGEIDRTSSFLSKDERNFHCWNFRRFLLSLLLGDFPLMKLLDSTVSQGTRLLSLNPQISCEGSSSHVPTFSDVKEILLLEWEFTTRKIQENFSNFSAFHYRTSLLCEWTRECFVSDWHLVENAVFTDPFDQTSWWYLRFLVSHTAERSIPAQWQRQAENLRDLRRSEPDCKWIVLGILFLVHSHGFPDRSLETETEKVTLWRTLREIDLVRRRIYHSSFLSIV